MNQREIDRMLDALAELHHLGGAELHDAIALHDDLKSCDGRSLTVELSTGRIFTARYAPDEHGNGENASFVGFRLDTTPERTLVVRAAHVVAYTIHWEETPEG